MSTLINDLKYACRMLAKRPGFTIIALITLALGIGVNTIMFSGVNALALRPVNVKEPEQLVICKTARVFGNRFDHTIFERIRADNPIFSDVMAFSGRGVCSLKLGELSTSGRKTFVSSNYFSVLGVTPARGRDFLPTEETPGTDTVGILSHHTWLRLGADPEVLGKVVSVNGHPCRIVGITPEGFSGPTLLGGPDIWLPLGAYANMLSEELQQRVAVRPGLYRYPTFLISIGRLKPGMPMSTAQAHFGSMSASLLELFHPSMREKNRHWLLQPLPRFFLDAPDSDLIIPFVCAVLMSAGVALLCIACLNLANMYIVQGASRHREIAVRTALGGSRVRIVRQLLAEALLLALLGGALGLLLAFWGMTLLNNSVTRPVALLRNIQFELDVRVLLATLGSCLVATLLSGLWPALRLSRRDIMSNLKELHGGLRQSSAKTGAFTPSGLSVAGQIALSVVLVMGAVLFTHSAFRAAYVTPGYAFDGKLVVDVDFRVERDKKVEREQLCRQLVDHMRSLPELQAVGLSSDLPFGDRWGGPDVKMMDAEGMQRYVGCMEQSIGGDYFQSVGMPLLQGRYFTREESTNQPSVVIVDETLARKLRPDGNVLGGRLIKRWQTVGREIVGIVPDVRHHVFEKQIQPHVYYPMSDPKAVYLILRVKDALVGTEKALLQRIRREIHLVDPRIAVNTVCPLSDRHRSGIEMWAARMVAGLSLFFGAAALFLATLGVYGVKGYRVAVRIPEFGIRMALGATGRDIVSMVLREGWILILFGLATGIACASVILHVLGTLLLKPVLCDVKPIDPVSIAATLILVTLAALLAGYIPARRVAKVDPMEALKCE